MDRGESPQLRIVGAGDGGEAIRAGVEPLRAGVRGYDGSMVGRLAVPLAGAVFADFLGASVLSATAIQKLNVIQHCKSTCISDDQVYYIPATWLAACILHVMYLRGNNPQWPP